jgi:hypothetical protein
MKLQFQLVQNDKERVADQKLLIFFTETNWIIISK